jgi:hypothetical protein
MNRVIQCYTEVDSIYDARRGITQKWLVRDLIKPDTDQMSDDEYAEYVKNLRYQGDALWEKYAQSNYKERRMDRFEYPGLTFDRAQFRELYKERSLADFKFGYYKTKFTQNFLKTIIDMELLTETPIMFNKIVLHVNIFPYVMDEPMRQELIDHLQLRFGGKVEVKTINSRSTTHDVSFYKQFDYVMKYDLLLGEDSKTLSESVGSIPIPGTTFIIPDILVRESDELTGEIADRIFSSMLQLAPVFRVMPIHHSFYDYA